VLGNQSGKLPLATQGWGFINFKRKKLVGKKIKDSRIKNQKEKAIKAIDSDYDGAYDYQQWQDELDKPRWYLEKKYPIFYKQFEKKFNQFINDWDSKTGENKIHADLKKELFSLFCRMIDAEIEAEYNIKSSIEYVEKNGLQKVKHNRISLQKMSFDQAINLLFEVPELIIASFTTKHEEFQRQLQEKLRDNNIWPGNYLGNRISGNFDRYKKVAKLMKVFEEHFPAVNGTQKIACEMADCNNFSFTRWKNYKSNIDVVIEWQKNVDQEEIIKLKNDIRTYLEK